MSLPTFLSIRGSTQKSPTEPGVYLRYEEDLRLFDDHLVFQAYEVESDDSYRFTHTEAHRFPVSPGAKEAISMALSEHRGQRGFFGFNHAPYFYRNVSSATHDFYYRGSESHQEAEIMAVLWEELGFERSKVREGDPVSFVDPYTDEMFEKFKYWHLPEYSRLSLSQRYVAESDVWDYVEGMMEQAWANGKSPKEIWMYGFSVYVMADLFDYEDLEDYAEFIPDEIWPIAVKIMTEIETDVPGARDQIGGVKRMSRLSRWGLLSKTQHWLAEHSPESLRDIGWRRCCEAAYRAERKGGARHYGWS
jgi:hypothetical protein